jgi:perosamine synthetase
MKIPWSIPNFGNEDIESIKKVLNSGWLTMGKEVEKFEKKLSSYLNIKYSVGVNTGTAALDIALKCIDIKRKDEVIIPSLTYIATGNAVLYNGGKPVFVDIDDTLNIDTSLIEESITEKTKAIINIDFGGNVSNYPELAKISKKYEIPLIVDGAQSLGSEYNGTKCCTHGLINTTSFHAAKILTTVEGGMLFTNNEKMYSISKSLRNQGEESKYHHPYLGNNYRMTDIIAAVGNSQVFRFEETLKNRKRKATYYKENLKNVEFPRELKNTFNSNFFFIILTEERDKLNFYLNKNGIDTRITYPLPINEQPLFKSESEKVFPVAKKISKKIISIPIYEGLTQEQQDYIIKKINNFTR